MRSEHRSKACANFEFETSNYKIKTTPSKEWMIVTGELKCPEDQMKFDRRIPDTDHLLSLSTANYTGPMVRACSFLLTLMFSDVNHKLAVYDLQRSVKTISC
jgi:hypothetical protein